MKPTIGLAILLVSIETEGQPDFLALLHGRRVPACVYAFDLIELDGHDRRDQPLERRRVSSAKK